MSSRKPQGAVERLPVDFETPRAPEKGHQMSPASRRTGDLGPLVHTSPEIQFDAVRAVTLVHNRTPETPETIAASGVVLGALGLLRPTPPASDLTGPLAVPCPQCGQAAGERCVTEKSGGRYQRGHRTRARRAQELREAAA